MTHLNLEGNELGDEICIKEICQGIVHTLGSIVFLNLSKCQITDVGAQGLAEVIANSSLNLKTLIVHWNQIRGRGSAALAKAIKKNQSLQIFDASFNSFGGGPF